MHRFLAEPDVAAAMDDYGATIVKATVDDVFRSVRAGDGSVPPYDVLLDSVRLGLAALDDASLVPVVNATGILLHTNLGRAPLAMEALDAAAAIARGFSNLEFDLANGKRGTRYERVTPLLRTLTGAQDALVVNNCAAAVLLILDTFAKGREVVVARNQLIEIGGGLRLPDVLARSGARLVEAGATNKVYLRDLERALSPNTALILRSHASNFRIEGFTADVAARDVAALGARTGIVTVEDLGSGALVDLSPYGLPRERTAADAVADGFDVVAFSGDKLLGGPQAGIVVGRIAPIARLRANPLLRALRVDKTTLAALGATLRLYAHPQTRTRIPLFAMLAAPLDELERRARAIDSAIPVARATPTEAFAGGGAAPQSALPSWGVTIGPTSANAATLAARLRAGRPRVIARIAGGAVVLDVRTIAPGDDADVIAVLRAALA